METIIALGIAVIAAGWLLHRALAPRATKTKDGGAAGGCGDCATGACPLRDARSRALDGRALDRGASGCPSQTPLPRDERQAPLALALLLCGSLSAGALLTPRAAEAADTVETWTKGAADVEPYFGVDGLGTERRGLSGDVLIGYGLTDWLGIYLGSTVRGTDDLQESETEVYGGLVATVLNTRHIDLDLMLELRGGGADFGRFSLRPSFELNLDHDPNMQTIGLYLRGGLPLYNRELTQVGHPTHSHTLDGLHAELTLGAYLTLAHNHQLLLEHDFELRPQAADDESSYGLGGLALGYNLTLNSTFELISQLYLDMPQAGEVWAFGVTFGVVITVAPNA